jgi:RHS repeat-associated protein
MVDASNTFRGTAQVSSGTSTVTLVARDPSGNQTTQQYEVDTSGSTTSYTYDANGNLTADGTKTYVWNALNQLVEVKEGTTTIVTFEYDGGGRRTEKVAAGLTHQYIYDAEDIVEERISGSSSDTIRYYHSAGIDEPLARTNASSVTTYYLADHLGSIVQETNASGAVTLEREYDPWGVATQGVSTSGYAFTGREWDAETGLYYYRARFRLPESGHFLSEDPIAFSGGSNFYQYVKASPVALVDPDGLQVMRMPQKPSEVPQALWDWFGPDPSDLMIGGPLSAVEALEKPTLTACKKALKKVHDIVGRMANGERGKFGTPTAGNSTRGYRGPEPPHPSAPPGSPETGWHFNWWDFTDGKWNSGAGPGKKGAIPIK